MLFLELENERDRRGGGGMGAKVGEGRQERGGERDR